METFTKYVFCPFLAFTKTILTLQICKTHSLTNPDMTNEKIEKCKIINNESIRGSIKGFAVNNDEDLIFFTEDSVYHVKHKEFRST